MGQLLLGSESMLNESFPDSQMRPGTAMGIGFSGMAATHNVPDEGSADKAEHSTDTITKAKNFSFVFSLTTINPFF
jgi:hypothetical protein